MCVATVVVRDHGWVEKLSRLIGVDLARDCVTCKVHMMVLLFVGGWLDVGCEFSDTNECSWNFVLAFC